MTSSRSAALLLLVVTIVPVGCGPLSARTPPDVTSILAQPIADLDLALLFPGDWQRAYVFGEWETSETMETALCFRWKEAEDAAPYAQSDAGYAIVFVRDDTVTDWVSVNAQGDSPAVAFSWSSPFFVDRRNSIFGSSSAIAGSRLLTPKFAFEPPSCPLR